MLKAPLVSYEANLFHPLFLYSIAQCLIMSLSDPLFVPMPSVLYIEGLSFAVFAEYLSILIAIDSDSKQFFKAKRYMDDILTFYVTNPQFDHKKLLKNHNATGLLLS